MTAYLNFQTAVFQLLAADSALGAMVSGIYDQPPSGTIYPYVTLGDGTSGDWSSKSFSGFEIRLSIEAWSREGGRAQTAAILSRLHAVLHLAGPAVSGYALALMRVEDSAIRLENDGLTFHGALSVRALLHPAT